ncbi:MAG: response regulator [Chromatiales bacterium]
MQILLVEDNVALGDGICAGLSGPDHRVEWLRDGLAAEQALRPGHRFDVVILDLGLPGRSGVEVLRELRQRGDPVPVVILTARDRVTDRVAGLDEGADDYMVKPFDLDELAARLRALHRRRAGRTRNLLEHGGLSVDPAAREARLDGEPVELSRREFVILVELLENTGRVLSRARLEQGLYGWDEEVASNAVEVHIHHLRRKLGRDLIRTVRGVGYIVPRHGV